MKLKILKLIVKAILLLQILFDFVRIMKLFHLFVDSNKLLNFFVRFKKEIKKLFIFLDLLCYFVVLLILVNKLYLKLNLKGFMSYEYEDNYKGFFKKI